MKYFMIIAYLINITSSFAFDLVSCAANCGYAESFREVTSQSEKLGTAYNKLLLNCSTAPLFIQAKSRRDGDFDYTLATLQNACVFQVGNECTCSSNCGSAFGYVEITQQSSSLAKAYASLARQCQRGILFIQAIQNDRNDFDYTFATLSNACSCYFLEND